MSYTNFMNNDMNNNYDIIILHRFLAQYFTYYPK